MNLQYIKATRRRYAISIVLCKKDKRGKKFIIVSQ